MTPSPTFEVLSKASALFWTTDESLRLTSINGLGLVASLPPAMIGAYLPNLWPESHFDQAPVEAHRRALEGRAIRFEFAANGREWWGRVEPVLGDGGQVSGVAAAVFDNTDRAFAEKSRRFSEQSYRSLIEEAPFAIARVTSSGQFLQVNRAMVEMLGYESEQELLICSLSTEVFQRPSSYTAFVSNLSDRGTLQGLESMWRRRDGKSISVSLAGRTTRDESGRILYLELLAENITERKQLEQQLRQAQKLQAVGQLAGGIAHDFNNLLTIINGQVQMALEELMPGSPLRERLEDVESAGSRAAKLTRQLLAFGRFNHLESKVLDLNEVVAGWTHMLVVFIGKSVEWEFIPGQGLGHVRADPVQLEQVLMNLVLNAKAAMPDSGRITISTENVRLGSSSPRDAHVAPPGDYVALSVVDTGQGMTPETLSHIFEPFFTTKKAGQGTGLGLATVYSIVKQSKGHIATASELGVGSRFTIYLPRVGNEARAETPSGPLAVHGGSETILFADDEEIIRRFTTSFLTRLGYRVLAAADGVEGIALAEEHASEIDLLITDVVMPRMGGRELAENVRRLKPGIPILFISGYAGDDSIRDAIKVMSAQFLQKPFPSMPALAKNIRDLLDRD